MIDDTWLCLKSLLLKITYNDFRFSHAFYSITFMDNFTSQLPVN